MKLITYLLDSFRPKKKSYKENLSNVVDSQKDTLFQTGRQQFKKLQELGLQIPVAVL